MLRQDGSQRANGTPHADHADNVRHVVDAEGEVRHVAPTSAEPTEVLIPAQPDVVREVIIENEDGEILEEIVTEDYIDSVGVTPSRAVLPAGYAAVAPAYVPVVRARRYHVLARAEDSGSLLRVTRALSYVLAAIEAVLLLRFFLKLIGANPASPFARLVYEISAPLVALFDRLVPDPRLGAQVVEVTTLVAMLFYILLFWGIVQLVRAALRPRLPS